MRLGRAAQLALFATLLLAFGCGPTRAETNIATAGTLHLLWGAPFVGLLLSIAFLPLAAPQFWHRHFVKLSVFWILAFLIPLLSAFGPLTAAQVTMHTFLAEFLPFIVILMALYTVAGGIYVQGSLRGTPLVNAAFLGFGSLLASAAGTTGASMVLIRPLIRANSMRKYNAHVVVFFIFLVSNIGGALTALGDPPLFLGYLKGVPFFWPAQHLLMSMLLCLGLLLSAFFMLDAWLFRREAHNEAPAPKSLKLHGGVNLVLIFCIGACILLTAQLKLGTFTWFGTTLQFSDILRDGLLLVIAALSLLLTPQHARQGNDFHWGPVREVTVLFAAIFLTAAPVLAMLQQGSGGSLGFLTQLVFHENGVANNAAFFWLTGGFSSFLDNAPTYLVFFQLAGGDAAALTGPLSTTLAAISCGAVFMGAMTYIGNAPNFMVRAIAESQGVRMPSFFGYMAWSCVFLLPVFAVVTLLFFN